MTAKGSRQPAKYRQPVVPTMRGPVELLSCGNGHLNLVLGEHARWKESHRFRVAKSLAPIKFTMIGVCGEGAFEVHTAVLRPGQSMACLALFHHEVQMPSDLRRMVEAAWRVGGDAAGLHSLQQKWPKATLPYWKRHP